MGTGTNPSIRVYCRRCDWRGVRVHRSADDPNSSDEGCRFGGCPSCGGRLARQAFHFDRRAAKAKADLAAFEQGGRA